MPASSEPAPGETRSTSWLPAVGIVLLTLAVYIPAMRSDFVWDDDAFLVKNPLIHADDGLYRLWCTTESVDYFPLTLSMLWVEWRLWGPEATGFHIVNVALHALAAVLLWRLLRRLRIPGAALVAAVFAVHPVNVESVAWITQRKNTLPMVFYLLTLIAFVRFEDEGRRRYYLFAVLAFALALLSKTSVVMLPFVLLILAWWRRGRITGRAMVRALPFFALSCVFGLVTVYFQYVNSIGDDPVRTDNFWARLAGAGWAVWFYLGKAVYPHPLMFVYPRWKIDPASVVSYLPDAALILVIAVLWQYRRTWGRSPLAAFAYFVITLFPVLGFLNIYFMRYSLVADHWQYTSIIGILTFVIGGLTHLLLGRAAPLRIPARAAAAALLVVFAWRSWDQCKIYRNKDTLRDDILVKNPDAWSARFNLANALAHDGKFEEAIPHYLKAIENEPSYHPAYLNLGNTLLKLGKLDEAITQYRRAIEARPSYAEAHCMMGSALIRLNRPQDAVQHYQRALTLAPEFHEARAWLADALDAAGRAGEAASVRQQAIQLAPDLPESFRQSGLARLQEGKLNEAVDMFDQALRLDPDFIEAHLQVADVLDQVNQPTQARNHRDQALALRPGLAELYNNQALELHKKGNLSDAIWLYQQAMRLKPDIAEIHNNLGWALQQSGYLDDAVEQYREAVRLKPDYEKARLNLTQLLAEQGRFDEAVQNYQSLIAGSPSKVEFRLELAEVLAKAGRASAAVEQYQAVLRAEPANAIAGERLRALQPAGAAP